MISRKAVQIAAASILLFAGSILIFTRGKAGESAGGSARAQSSSRPGENRGHAPKPSPGRAGKQSATRTAGREVAHPDLAAKFGEARTNLSKHVAGGVIGLFEDTVEMNDLMDGGGLGELVRGPGEMLEQSLGDLHQKLGLTGGQKDRATAAFVEYKKRDAVRKRETIERLRKDPTSLMSLLLASDAFARKEITEEEYQQLHAGASRDDLGQLANPFDPGDGGNDPLEEEQFMKDLSAVLEPAQADILQRELAARRAQEAAGEDTAAITRMSPEELEKVDQAITSARKMVTGMRSLIEGLGGMKDLDPRTE